MTNIKYTHILAYSPQASNTYVYHYVSNDVADLYETKIRLKKEPQIKYSEFVSSKSTKLSIQPSSLFCNVMVY